MFWWRKVDCQVVTLALLHNSPRSGPRGVDSSGRWSLKALGASTSYHFLVCAVHVVEQAAEDASCVRTQVVNVVAHRCKQDYREAG